MLMTFASLGFDKLDFDEKLALVGQLWDDLVIASPPGGLLTEAQKEELLKICLGKFAVFRGNEFLGTYDTMVAAYEAGISKWGNVEFLIKPILKEEKPEQFPALYLGLLNAGS